MRNRRKAAAIVLCALLAVSACTSPPASVPAPAASNAASDLPAINTSISHEVPSSLTDVELFGQALGSYDLTVVPVAGFDKFSPDDPNLVTTPLHDYWNDCDDVRQPFKESEFAIFAEGGSCTEGVDLPGVLRDGEFTPFTGSLSTTNSVGNALTLRRSLIYSENGVLWTRASLNDWNDFDLIYGDLQTFEASRVLDFETLLESFKGDYGLQTNSALGAWLDGERVLLEMLMTDYSERDPEGSFLPFSLVSMNLDGSDHRVEMTRVSPQAWGERTAASRILVDRVDSGRRVLHERTGIGEFAEVFSLPLDSPQAPPQVFFGTPWASKFQDTLIVALGDYLLVAQEQDPAVTLIDLGTPPRGENTGVTDVQISDSHVALRYRLYAQELSGVYVLNRETFAGNMTIVAEEVGPLTLGDETLSFEQLTHGFDEMSGETIVFPLP